MWIFTCFIYIHYQTSLDEKNYRQNINVHLKLTLTLTDILFLNWKQNINENGAPLLLTANYLFIMKNILVYYFTYTLFV